MKRLTLSLAILFLAFSRAFPQPPVEMADTMRSNGKIYVVVAVIVTILAGLVLYLVRIDNKLKRLEKDNRVSGS